MIPTREQIEADWANPRPETTALIWLRAMRAEIDRLKEAAEEMQRRLASLTRERNILRTAIIGIGCAVGGSVSEACTTDYLCHVEGEAKSVLAELRSEIKCLTAELADAKKDRDALKATIEECRRALPPGTDGPGIVGGVLHLVEQRDALAKATTPAPEREAKIRAWEARAMAVDHMWPNRSPSRREGAAMTAFASKTAAELLAKTQEQMDKLRHERKEALKLAVQKSAAIDAIESVMWRIEDLVKHEAEQAAKEQP